MTRTTLRIGVAILSLSSAWILSSSAAPARNAQVVAAEIDAFINKRLAEAKIPASPLADDAEFIRRVCLDISGRIPTSERTAAFLKSTDPDKRRKLIDELLEDSEYGEHFATNWYHQMVKPDDDNR